MIVWPIFVIDALDALDASDAKIRRCVSDALDAGGQLGVRASRLLAPQKAESEKRRNASGLSAESDQEQDASGESVRPSAQVRKQASGAIALVLMPPRPPRCNFFFRKRYC